MSILKDTLEEIKHFYKTMCTPPFSEYEIQETLCARALKDESEWESHVDKKGCSPFSYSLLIIEGFVLSKVSSGDRKGELCLYNRKTNKTIFAEDYVIKEEKQYG